MNVGAAAYWFRTGFLRRWRSQVLFVYGTDHSEWSPNRFAELGIRYHCMPFASNPAVMRPLNLPRMYDVVFAGSARSETGRARYTDLLFDELDPAKALFIGPGWERYGFPNQHIAWGPLLNLVYNLGSICINISNDEQKMGNGTKDFQRLDANNRLFDLAMAGCFQISNAPQIVRRYFDESEVIAIDEPDEWVAAISHYLEHPAEMESLRKRARQRALAEHAWEYRAKSFGDTIKELLPKWRSSPKEFSHWQKLSQIRDLALWPYGSDELMARVRRKVGSTTAGARQESAGKVWV